MRKNEKNFYENKEIRSVWDEEKEEWFFSVVDIVAVLTGQDDYQAARNYWKVTKSRLKKEGNQTVTNCNQLKLKAKDGKMKFNSLIPELTV